MSQVNLNNPRSMETPFNKRMPVTTVLRDTFFPGTKTHVTEHVDLDFRKGSQAVAPFVAKGVGGINMARQGYETRTYTPPRVAPERPLSPEVLQSRLPGETLHTAQSPEDRQDYYLQQDAQELDDAITRREEVMAAELLTSGKVTVRGYLDENRKDYTENVLDFQFDNLMDLTGDDSWTKAPSNKYGDLESACERIMKAGYNPRHAFLGSEAWDLLKNDPTFQKQFDLLRYNIGQLAPELRVQNGNGVKYIGHITDLGLDFWVYFAWYLGEDGLMHPYIPTNQIVIGPESIGEMVYGAVTQLEKDERFHTYEGTRVPKLLVDVNNNRMGYRLTSRPLPRPFDVDSWVRLKVTE